MNTGIIQIVIAIIGSGGFFAFLQFLINRIDTKVGILKKIQQRLDYIDQGLIRMQLLVLISNYPDRVDEIMLLAEQYFCKFHGNYYLTSLFKKYLDDSLLAYPLWFHPTHHEQGIEVTK